MFAIDSRKFQRLKRAAAGILLLNVASVANAVVIDFESDAQGNQGLQFVNADDFIFSYEDPGQIPPGSLAGLTVLNAVVAANSLTGAGPGHELAWAADSYPFGVIILPLNNQPFDLNSFDLGVWHLYGLFPGAGPFTVRITGTTTAPSAPNIETVTVDIPAYFSNPVGQVIFDSQWDAIYRFKLELLGTNGGGLIAIDNINLTFPGSQIDVGLSVEDVLHPHHIGGGTVPDDSVSVVVHGSSIANGDLIDFFTDDIDETTVRFAPNLAAIDPGSTSQFNIDKDLDGDEDVRFFFKMADTGMSCPEISLTLTGQTTAVEDFNGTDSTLSFNCNAGCH